MELDDTEEGLLKLFTEQQKCFQKQLLNEHNRIRELHNLPNLKLSTILSILATNWANILAENDTMEYCKHVSNAKYCIDAKFNRLIDDLIKSFDETAFGQNLHFHPIVSSNLNIKLLCKIITEKWYKDIEQSKKTILSESKQHLNDYQLELEFIESSSNFLHCYRSVNMLQNDSKLAGFGYCVSRRTGYLYAVSFYYPV